MTPAYRLSRSGRAAVAGTVGSSRETMLWSVSSGTSLDKGKDRPTSLAWKGVRARPAPVDREPNTVKVLAAQLTSA